MKERKKKRKNERKKRIKKIVYLFQKNPFGDISRDKNTHHRRLVLKIVLFIIRLFPVL